MEITPKELEVQIALGLTDWLKCVGCNKICTKDDADHSRYYTRPMKTITGMTIYTYQESENIIYYCKYCGLVMYKITDK